MRRHYPAFESPDPAMGRAVAWAAGRLGHHLRVEPAGRVPVEWDDQEAARLIEDARLWDRVRTERVIDPQDFLERVVGGLWGARQDGPGGRLELRPAVPLGWKSMAIRRLRAHRTLLDLEARARAEWLNLRIKVVFGPPVPVLVRLPVGQAVTGVTVDLVPLGAGQAIFTAQDEHEVTLYHG